ncbi:MAG: ATP-binding protein [Syntrophobacter sp.]
MKAPEQYQPRTTAVIDDLGSSPPAAGRAFITGISTILLAVILSLSFYFLYHSPTAGISVSWDAARQHYRVVWSQPGSPFEKGDFVHRIGNLDITFFHLLNDNIYINSRDEFFSWLEAKRQVFEELRKPRITFTIERNGGRLELDVTPARAGLSFLNHIELLHLAVGIIFFLIGTITFYKSGHGEQGTVFHLLCLTLTLVFVTNATSLMSDLAYEPTYLRLVNLTNLVCLPLGNAILFHFSLLVPRKRQFLVRLPLLPYLFYGVNILIEISLRIPLINFFVALYAPLTMISIFHAFFTYRQPLERQQMKWMAAGFVFGLTPWIFINGIPMVITGQRLMNDTIPATFVVCIPLFMAFAMRKYRLLDIDAFLEGTFSYLVTLVLLGVIDLSLMGFLSTRLGSELATSVTGKTFLSILLIVSLYAAIRDRARLFVRKICKREVLNEGAILSSFTDRASGQSSRSIIAILGQTIEETFRPRQLVLVNAEGTDKEAIFMAFRGRREPVLLWERSLNPPLPYEDIHIALPVTGGEELKAVILLGSLPEVSFYNRDHIAILTGLLGLANILVQSADLYDEAFRQKRISVEKERMYLKEKENMLRDLHDGVGGIMTNVNLIAEIALNSPTLQDAPRALSGICELSRQGISEVRSFMKSLDSRDTNWHTLAVDFRLFGKNLIESQGMAFNIQTNIADGDAQPGSMHCLNLYKIYREALTNIVKHSHANTVSVTFDVTQERLLLRVQDNGLGLRGEMDKGRGVANMKLRAERIGGTLSLVDDKGICVSLKIALPLKYPARSMEIDPESE